MKAEKIQWHPGFYAAFQIEFGKERRYLTFENEHQLSKKPMAIDILVIKKQPGTRIQKNIGRFFRQYNIIEYKSPDDYLSINDYYKVMGYACFYQADTDTVLKVNPEEVTVTLVCNHYPVKMISYLEGKLGTRAERREEGIYYINGGLFPMQILINNQLSRKENLWLSRLRGGLTSEEDIPLLTKAYIENREDPLYDAAMNLILSVNKKQLKEVTKMGELVNKFFADLMEESVRKTEEKGRAEGEQRLANLYKALLQDGRSEEYLRAVEEVAYRQQLYEEYKI